MKIYEVVQEGVGDWVKGAFKGALNKLTGPKQSDPTKQYQKAQKNFDKTNQKRANGLLTALIQHMAKANIPNVTQKQLMGYFQKNGLAPVGMSYSVKDFFKAPYDTAYSPQQLKPVFIKYLEWLEQKGASSQFDYEEPEQQADQSQPETPTPNDMDQDVEDIKSVRRRSYKKGK